MQVLDQVFPWLLYAAGGAVLLAFVTILWLRPRRRAQRQLLELFDLDGRQWRAIASDLHKSELPVKVLRGSGVAGIPDAVFVHRRERRVIVADLKSRTADSPHHYERFQMLLYQGLAQKQYPQCDVEGLVRYKNQVLSIPFEPSLFDQLIGLREEYRRSRKRKKAVDARPLVERLQGKSDASVSG